MRARCFKIVTKSLLCALNDKQRRDMLGNISLVIEDTSSRYPHHNEVINLTEQYVKKLIKHKLII